MCLPRVQARLSARDKDVHAPSDERVERQGVPDGRLTSWLAWIKDPVGRRESRTPALDDHRPEERSQRRMCMAPQTPTGAASPQLLLLSFSHMTRRNVLPFQYAAENGNPTRQPCGVGRQDGSQETSWHRATAQRARRWALYFEH